MNFVQIPLIFILQSDSCEGVVAEFDKDCGEVRRPKSGSSICMSYGHLHVYVILTCACLWNVDVYMSMQCGHVHVNGVWTFTCLCNIDIYMSM